MNICPGALENRGMKQNDKKSVHCAKKSVLFLGILNVRVPEKRKGGVR